MRLARSMLEKNKEKNTSKEFLYQYC